MKHSLSIIIPVFKNLRGLKAVISDLRQSDIAIAYEIIVCNDGANRFISDWLTDQGIKEISIGKKQGSYFARNRGIEASMGNWLLFVDADVEVFPNWFQHIEAQLDTYDYFAFNVKVKTNSKDALCKRYSVYKEFQTKQFFEERHFGVTAFILVKKSLIQTIGAFEQRVMSGGDLEFGMRTHSAGFKQYFQEQHFVSHKPRTLFQKFKKQIRANKGQLKLSLLGKIELYDKYSLINAFLMPFKTIWRIYSTVQKREKRHFNRSEIFIAECAEYSIVLFAFWLVLLLKPYYFFKLKDEKK